MSDEIHPDCVRGGIRFPNEILGLIINDLAPDTEEDNDSSRTSLAALTSCRLASQALYSVATSVLFSSIHLTDLDKAKTTPGEKRLATLRARATKLKEILTTTSNIAASVHSLTVRCHRVNFENPISSALISEITNRLPHIRTFILEGKGKSYASIREDFKSAIEALCRSPNLTTLDIEYIGSFPITIITTCPNLRYLRLVHVDLSFEHLSLINLTSNLQPYELESLEIDSDTLSYFLRDDNKLLGEILLAHLLRRIKNLQLDNLFRQRESLQREWDIMLQVSQSITTLHLGRYSETLLGWSQEFSVERVASFDLGRFPALRHFKIQLVEIQFYDNVTMLGHLSRLLSVSSSTSGIETLEIMITWIDVKTGGEKDLISPDAGWSMLDEVLSSHEFVSLKKVVLRLGMIMKGRNRKACYSLTPPDVNSLFSMFTLTSSQRTLEIH